jgi:hypothetical protein
MRQQEAPYRLAGTGQRSTAALRRQGRHVRSRRRVVGIRRCIRRRLAFRIGVLHHGAIRGTAAAVIKPPGDEGDRSIFRSEE